MSLGCPLRSRVSSLPDGLSAPGPREILWEVPVGILICVLLLMLGVVGLKGLGALAFFFNYVIVPAAAVIVSYVGVKVGRGELQLRPNAQSQGQTEFQNRKQ